MVANREVVSFAAADDVASAPAAGVPEVAVVVADERVVSVAAEQQIVASGADGVANGRPQVARDAVGIRPSVDEVVVPAARE